MVERQPKFKNKSAPLTPVQDLDSRYWQGVVEVRAAPKNIQPNGADRGSHYFYSEKISLVGNRFFLGWPNFSSFPGLFPPGLFLTAAHG